jgi:hypothetical protein
MHIIGTYVLGRANFLAVAGLQRPRGCVHVQVNPSLQETINLMPACTSARDRAGRCRLGWRLPPLPSCRGGAPLALGPSSSEGVLPSRQEQPEQIKHSRACLQLVTHVKSKLQHNQLRGPVQPGAQEASSCLCAHHLTRVEGKSSLQLAKSMLSPLGLCRRHALSRIHSAKSIVLWSAAGHAAADRSSHGSTAAATAAPSHLSACRLGPGVRRRQL